MISLTGILFFLLRISFRIPEKILKCCKINNTEWMNSMDSGNGIANKLAGIYLRDSLIYLRSINRHVINFRSSFHSLIFASSGYLSK